MHNEVSIYAYLAILVHDSAAQFIAAAGGYVTATFAMKAQRGRNPPTDAWVWALDYPPPPPTRPNVTVTTTLHPMRVSYGEMALTLAVILHLFQIDLKKNKVKRLNSNCSFQCVVIQQPLHKNQKKLQVTYYNFNTAVSVNNSTISRAIAGFVWSSCSYKALQTSCACMHVDTWCE